MGKWLAVAWRMICKAPVAQYIRPVWKAGLKIAVQEGGDMIQSEFQALLSREGDKAISQMNARIDRMQERFAAWVDALPFPPQVEERVAGIVNGAVDALQSRLRAATISGSAVACRAAVDAAFDEFQASVKAKIDAL